jgi:hypothetical protein
MPAIAAETAVHRLATELLDGRTDALAEELEHWMVESRRVRAFVTDHRQKIRKKLRAAADSESRLDVRAELRAAALLLADRRVELAFEAYGATAGGPDFTVTLGGARPFNVEVTRLRGGPGGRAIGAPILAKLRQLPPSRPNVLLIAVDGDDAGAIDVAATVRALRGRADARDDPFFATRGIAGSRGFYDRFRRLSAVIVWCEAAAGDARAAAWHNPSARIPLPDRAMRACLAGLRAA